MEELGFDENGPGEVAVLAGIPAGGGFAGGGSGAGGFLGVQTVGGDLSFSGHGELLVESFQLRAIINREFTNILGLIAG
jgi:hypothetical protein